MKDSMRLSVQKIRRLPTMPATAQHVVNLTFDDSLSIEKLEGIIENDPPIASKILSVSNSAFFGIEVPNATIADAVVRIGFDNVRNIAISIALLTFLENGKSDHPVDPKRIFRHSVAVGAVAKSLSHTFRLGSPDEMFVCGMLHDLGIFVLNSYFCDMYTGVIKRVMAGESLLAAEIKVMEFTHPVIGEWLAEAWNLPAAVSACIRLHHEPPEACGVHIGLVHLADYISSKKFPNVTGAAKPETPDDAVLGTLNISRQDLAAIEADMGKGILSEGSYVHE